MYKLCLLLAFVLLSQEARGYRIKGQWDDNGGDFVDWNQGFQDPNGKTNPTSSGNILESIMLQDCLQSCPVTSEYNPVCGTDNVTYDNPGRLLCAQSCGVNVTKMRASRCSAKRVPSV